MRKSIIVACLLVALSTTVSAGSGIDGHIWATADNFYKLYVNVDMSVAQNGASGYVLDNYSGNNQPTNWGTIEDGNVSFNYGNNIVYVNASNSGSWSTANPAGFISKIQVGGQTIVTGSAWEWYAGSDKGWQSVVQIDKWNEGIWATGSNAKWAKAPIDGSQNLWTAFNGTNAQWVWDIAVQDNIEYRF